MIYIVIGLCEHRGGGGGAWNESIYIKMCVCVYSNRSFHTVFHIKVYLCKGVSIFISALIIKLPDY